jgi:urease accessory protein UreF
MYKRTFESLMEDFRGEELNNYIESIASIAQTPKEAEQMGQQMLKTLADKLAAIDWQAEFERIHNRAQVPNPLEQLGENNRNSRPENPQNREASERWLNEGGSDKE